MKKQVAVRAGSGSSIIMHPTLHPHLRVSQQTVRAARSAQILHMLEDKKITMEEAEQLLSALEGNV